MNGLEQWRQPEVEGKLWQLGWCKLSSWLAVGNGRERTTFTRVGECEYVLTFGIELMFPKDGQILVVDFRHQNFGIWTFLG